MNSKLQEFLLYIINNELRYEEVNLGYDSAEFKKKSLMTYIKILKDIL